MNTNTNTDNNSLRKERCPTVLVVDDEAMVRGYIQEYLQICGMKVATAENGEDALALFRDSPQNFDIVLTDYTMPKRNGFSLATEILKINPNIPIILWTGYSADVSKDTAIAAGIKAYFEKPIDGTALIQAIDELTEAHTR